VGRRADADRSAASPGPEGGPGVARPPAPVRRAHPPCFPVGPLTWELSRRTSGPSVATAGPARHHRRPQAESAVHTKVSVGRVPAPSVARRRGTSSPSPARSLSASERSNPVPDLLDQRHGPEAPSDRRVSAKVVPPDPEVGPHDRGCRRCHPQHRYLDTSMCRQTIHRHLDVSASPSGHPAGPGRDGRRRSPGRGHAPPRARRRQAKLDEGAPTREDARGRDQPVDRVLVL
jgi:hypothetical protein